MKKIGFALALLLLLLASGAMADMNTYTFGGSGADVLSGITAGADGRFYLTGYTDSTDGTLARRTSDGRIGWLMCVDAQGSELWSFCSRNGEMDAMSLPVAHADGTVSVLLRSDDEDAWFNEVLLFSSSGELISRRRIEDGRAVIRVTTDDCYVFSGYSDDHRVYLASDWEFDHEGYATPLLYGPDGTSMGELPAWEGVIELSRGEMSIRQFDGLQWLYRRDASGAETAIASIDGTQRELGGLYPKKYDDMLQNEDGSIAACGYGFEWIDKSEGKTEDYGVFSLFDGDGRMLLEMRFPAGVLVELERVPGGYAAVVQAYSGYNENIEVYENEYTLMYLDGQGVAAGSVPLGASNADDCGCPLAALPDGTVAALRVTGAPGEQDTQLTIIRQ